MTNQFTNWLLALQHAPVYMDDNLVLDGITKQAIWQVIRESENYVKSALKGYYNNFDLTTADYFSVCKQSNFDTDFVLDFDEITTVNLNTMVYRIEFTSPTLIKITPDIGTILVNKDITAAIDLGDIIIESAAWQGRTFQLGDVILLSVVYREPTIVDLVSKYTAARIIETTFSSETSSGSQDARNLMQQVNATLGRLTNPKNPQLLTTSKIPLDLTPIGFYDKDLPVSENDQVYFGNEIE